MPIGFSIGGTPVEAPRMIEENTEPKLNKDCVDELELDNNDDDEKKENKIVGKD